MNKILLALSLISVIGDWAIQSTADGVVTADEAVALVKRICLVFRVKASIDIPALQGDVSRETLEVGS